MSEETTLRPGDLVETFNPPGSNVIWDELRPGMQGVVTSFPCRREPPPGFMYWCDVVDVRFASLTTPVGVNVLKKILPPPMDEVETDDIEVTA